MIANRGILAERQSEEEFVLSQFSSKISVTTNDAIQCCSSISAMKNGRSCSPDSCSGKATQEEAQLLMNLLSPVPNKSNVGWNPQSGPFSHSPIMSPVFSSNYNQHEEMARPLSMKDDTAFEFTCSSLSLASSDFLLPSISNNTARTLTSSAAALSRTRANHIVPPSPSLTNKPTPNNNVNNSNTSLCNTPTRMSVKEQNQRELLHLPKLLDREMTNPVKTWKDVLPKAENLAENIQSTFELIVDSRIQIWMDSISRVLRLREEAKKMRDDASSSAGASAKDVAVENSQDSTTSAVEADSKNKVFDALTRVSSNISVSKVRTYYRVLSKQQRKHSSPYHRGISSSENIVSPPPKKRSKLNVECASDVVELERPLEFIATIEVAPYDLTLTLCAPGTLKGIFLPMSNNQGKKEGDRLLGVDLQLDMDALVKSLRRKSRYVARKAAESELFSPTPTAAGVPGKDSNSNNTTASRKGAGRTAMPPPPPRISKLMGIVSPSPGSPELKQHQSSQSSSSSSNTFHNHGKDTNSLPESILAPLMKDSDRKVSSSSSSEGEEENSCQETNPSLPMLVEVACASFAVEKPSMMTSS